MQKRLTIICQLSIIERLIERNRRADMAQLVERVLGKDEVTGSNPVISSIKMPDRTKKVRSGVFLFSARIFFAPAFSLKQNRAHIAPSDTHS